MAIALGTPKPERGSRALVPQKKASRRHARGERAAGALRVQARTLDARSLSTHARAGLTLALDPRSRWTHARAGLTLALRVARTERRRGRGDGHPRGGLHHLLQLARRPEAGCAMRRAPMTRRQMTRRGAAESVVEQSGMGTSTSKKPRLLPRRREHTGHARATSRSWAAQRSGEQAAAAASVRGGARVLLRRRHRVCGVGTCCRRAAGRRRAAQHVQQALISPDSGPLLQQRRKVHAPPQAAAFFTLDRTTVGGLRPEGDAYYKFNIAPPFFESSFNRHGRYSLVARRSRPLPLRSFISSRLRSFTRASRSSPCRPHPSSEGTARLAVRPAVAVINPRLWLVASITGCQVGQRYDDGRPAAVASSSS